MDQNSITWSALAISAIAFTASMAGVATSRDLLKLQNQIDEGVSFGPEAPGGELPIEEPGDRVGINGPCPQTAKGGGLGGNSVSCFFPCLRFDLITIKVQSADNVYVWGSGSCGDASASCSGKPSCAGASGRWARRDDTRGGCSAGSDEAWKSALTVSCEGVPGCTNPIACMEDLANQEGDQPPEA